MIETLKKQIEETEEALRKNEAECKKLRKSLGSLKKTFELYEQGLECGTEIMALYNGMKASGMPDDLAKELLLSQAVTATLEV